MQTVSVRRSTITALEVGRQIIRQEAKALLRLAEAQDQSFERCVDLLLHTSGRVAVTGMGKSGHIARKVAATLASTGTPAYFIHPAEASHGDLGMMSPQDALIAISRSGNSAELSDILFYAEEHGLSVIAITSNSQSPLGKHAKLCLPLPALHEACPLDCAPTTSTTMSLALGDALAMALMHARGFTLENFKCFHPGGALGKKLMKVKDIMHTGDALPLVKPNTPMSEVLLVMTSKGFGCAGVVDEEAKLIGIITDGDLRRHLGPNFLEKNAYSIMTKPPFTIDEITSVEKASFLMYKKKISCIFVIKHQIPYGIINIHQCS